MAFDLEDKTEAPTERRRRMAREQGLGPRSADLTAACRWLGLAAGWQWFGARLVRELSQLMSEGMQRPATGKLSIDVISGHLLQTAFDVGSTVLACVLLTLVAGLVAQWFQTGFRFQPSEVTPDFSRLSPIRGWTKLWRLESLSGVLSAATKYLVLLLIGLWWLWSRLGGFSALIEAEIAEIADVVGHSLLSLLWTLTGSYLVLGLASYGYRYWKFERSLMMSPEELREEQRQQGGHPLVRQRQRQFQNRALVQETGSIS